MSDLKCIQEMAEKARQLNAKAATMLHALLPRGTAIEFKCGNMTHIDEAEVIAVCNTGRELGVLIYNKESGNEREILASAIVGLKEPEPPIEEPPPGFKGCEQCRTPRSLAGMLIECNCGRLLGRNCCYGNCTGCD